MLPLPLELVDLRYRSYDNTRLLKKCDTGVLVLDVMQCDKL
jgi:hypothetical protein